MGTVSAVTTYFIRRAGETWDRYGVQWSAKAARKAAVGIIGGVLTGCAWTALVWFQAPFHLEINPNRNVVHVIFGVVATFAIGIGEEVGYRSYAMKQAQRLSGVLGALLIPTSIFILAHLAGGMPWQAGLLVVGTCSLLYGVLMLATRSLPLVAAFHIGNNLVQDWILRTSNDSLWQVHFQDISAAEHSAFPIWAGIASVNLVIIAAIIVWKRAGGINSRIEPSLG